MISVHLPHDLATELGIGEESLQPHAPTLGALLRTMDTAHAGLLRSLTEAHGGLRPHINVFIGDRLARGTDGPSMTLADGDAVWVIRAISGG